MSNPLRGDINMRTPKQITKLLAGFFIFLSFAIKTEAQNFDLRSAEDVELLVATKQAGTLMPSQEAMNAYGLDVQDRAVLARIAHTNFIDLQNPAHERVYLKAIRPAAALIASMNTETIEDSRRNGIDLKSLRAQRALAYEIVSAVGQEVNSIGRLAAVGIENGAAIGRICVIAVSFADSFYFTLEAGDEGDGLFSLSQISGGASLRNGGAGDLIIGDEGCRPDKNDLICNPSGDPLTSDTCDPMTNKYCRLTTPTGGGNVRKCTAASDDP